MDFSDALRQLAKGAQIARKAWVKGAFLYLVPGSHFNVNRKPLLGIYKEGDEVDYRPHVDMRTASGEHVPWSATHSDLLGDDWEVVAHPEDDQGEGQPHDFRANQFQLPVWRSHKIVAAARIRSIERSAAAGMHSRLELVDEGGVLIRAISLPDEYMMKHEPHPGGYFVQYEDGYQSFSPAPAFEGGYTRV